MIAALTFVGIALGEPISTVIKERGPLVSADRSRATYTWKVEQPVNPAIFGAAPLPFSSKIDTFLAYFGPDDSAEGLYFDGPGDGGLREIVYGYRDALAAYGVSLQPK